MCFICNMDYLERFMTPSILLFRFDKQKAWSGVARYDLVAERANAAA